MNLGSTDIAILEGDSIVDTRFSYQIFAYPIARIYKTLAPTIAPPVVGTWPPTPVASVKAWPPTPVASVKAWPPTVADTKPPQTYNLGINGSTTAQLAARIAADIAAVPGATAFLCHIGINDSRTAVLVSTTLTNLTTVDSALVAAGITKKFLSGPLCNGEKWPTGQNDVTIDAAIESLDAALVTWAAAHGWTYVSQRQAVYAVQEPLTNTPGPGATSASVCFGDVNGIHPFGFNASPSTAGIGQRVCGDLILTQLAAA